MGTTTPVPKFPSKDALLNQSRRKKGQGSLSPFRRDRGRWPHSQKGQGSLAPFSGWPFHLAAPAADPGMLAPPGEIASSADARSPLADTASAWRSESAPAALARSRRP